MGAKVISLLVIGALTGFCPWSGAVVTGAIVLTAKGHEPFADPETCGPWRWRCSCSGSGRSSVSASAS